jgi:hypothetical protein
MASGNGAAGVGRPVAPDDIGAGFCINAQDGVTAWAAALDGLLGESAAPGAGRA